MPGHHVANPYWLDYWRDIRVQGKVMINKEYSDAWNESAPAEESDGFDVSKFENATKYAGNGLSFQTNAGLKRMDHEDAKPVAEHDPVVTKQYARPPGVQPMTESQASKLQEIQKRRASDQKALQAGKHIP